MDLGNSTSTSSSISDDGMNKYIASVFGWMFIGLMATALTSLFLAVGSINSPFINSLAIMLINSYWLLCIGELILVVVLVNKVSKNTISPAGAKGMFLVYAMINGVTVGLISLVYVDPFIVATAFGLTSLSFGAMAIYGTVTKNDLTKVGNLAVMLLFGLIIGAFFNLFIRSEGLYFMGTIVGLFIFMILVAVDTKKIKQYYYAVGENTDSDYAKNIAILGALALYLDFINIFIYFIRLLSRRNR